LRWKLRRGNSSTGEQGIARIGERSFDLVLLDLALPDRNGMDLLANYAAWIGNFQSS